MMNLISHSGGKANESGMGVVKATKRLKHSLSWFTSFSSWFPSSSSWFSSSSLMSSSSSLTSSISHSEMTSSVTIGDFVIDDRLTVFQNEEVTPLRLWHYRVPMDNTFGFCHHFGLLEVRLPFPSNLTNTLILFEKFKVKDVDKPAKEGGGEELSKLAGGRVVVQIFDQTRLRQPKTEMLLEVNLEGCSKIRMQDLFDLLTTEHTLSYNLWTNNCWKYVYDCQNKMLGAFAQLAGTSPVCKGLLEQAQQNLRAPKLLSDVFDWKIFTTFALGVVKSMAVKGLGTYLDVNRAILWKLGPKWIQDVLVVVLEHAPIGTAILIILISVWLLMNVAVDNNIHAGNDSR